MDLDGPGHDLTHAQGAVGAVLAAVTSDLWHRPSPCGDWDVAAVTRHLVVGERAFTTSLGGEAYDLPAIAVEVDRIPVDELAATYDAGAAALRTALERAQPGAAFPTGLGPMPAPAVDQLRTIEALVHGWDIARGAGLEIVVDDAVVDRAHTHSLALLERLPPERQVFGAPQPVPNTAAPLERLVALLGRDPA